MIADGWLPHHFAFFAKGWALGTTNPHKTCISRSLRKGGHTNPAHIRHDAPTTKRLPHHFAFFAKGWAQRTRTHDVLPTQRGCPTISRSLRKGGHKNPDFDDVYHNQPRMPHHFAFFAKEPALRAAKGWAPRTRTFMHDVPSSKEAAPPFRVLCERACPERSRRGGHHEPALTMSYQAKRLPHHFAFFAKGWAPRTRTHDDPQANRGCPTISRSLRKGGHNEPRTHTHDVLFIQISHVTGPATPSSIARPAILSASLI